MQMLAVTRTLGDKDMRESGCISEPDVTTLQLGRRDMAIVLATDGLWDAGHGAIRVADVANAISRVRPDPPSACTALINLVNATGGNEDDCTVAVIFVARQWRSGQSRMSL